MRPPVAALSYKDAAMSSRAGATKQLTTVAALTAVALLVFVTGAIIVRRLSGSFEQPLGGAAFLGTALLGAGIAAAVRLAVLKKHSHSMACMTDLLRSAVAGAIALVLLAAVTLPGTPAACVALGWFGLATAEGATWLLLLHGIPLGWRRPAQRGTCHLPVAARLDEERDEELPAGLVQQMTRIRSDEGESIHALLAIDVPDGRPPSAVHLAFCPPLSSPPELTAHLLDGDAAAVRITRSETFGARVDLDWKGAAAVGRVVLEVLGRASDPSLQPKA
jgi:hypothetical protein